jgi:hypothetical protein
MVKNHVVDGGIVHQFIVDLNTGEYLKASNALN